MKLMQTMQMMSVMQMKLVFDDVVYVDYEHDVDRVAVDDVDDVCDVDDVDDG